MTVITFLITNSMLRNIYQECTKEISIDVLLRAGQGRAGQSRAGHDRAGQVQQIMILRAKE